MSIKRLYLWPLLFVAFVTSCTSRDYEPEEYYDIAGEYVGTYRTINLISVSADEYMDNSNYFSWPSASASVHVKVEDDMLTVLIESSLGVKRIKVPYKHSDDVIRYEDISSGNNVTEYLEIFDDQVRYYRQSTVHTSTSFKNDVFVTTYSFSGEYLVAYKL